MPDGQGITLSFDDRALTRLANEGYKPEFGARELRRLIRTSIETPLSRLMLGGEAQDGDTVDVTVADGELKLTAKKMVAPPPAGDEPAAEAIKRAGATKARKTSAPKKSKNNASHPKEDGSPPPGA